MQISTKQTPPVQQGFITRRRLLVAGGLLILAIVGWWPTAYPRGMLVAWFDQVRGHYEIQVYGGPPAPWEGEWRRLTLERYGIEVNPVAGCVVTSDLVWYVDGYNAVSRTRIEARFGKDIFTECADEAKKAWDREHPEPQ